MLFFAEFIKRSKNAFPLVGRQGIQVRTKVVSVFQNIDFQKALPDCLGTKGLNKSDLLTISNALSLHESTEKQNLKLMKEATSLSLTRHSGSVTSSAAAK